MKQTPSEQDRYVVKPVVAAFGDREENELGCVCYAAPIFGAGTQPIGALSVSIPTSRLTSRLDLDMPEAVRSAGLRISAKAKRQAGMESLLAAHRSGRGRGR